MTELSALLIFPGGLALLLTALLYEWFNRKLAARLQNRVGPRWYQPFADLVKLLAKEEIYPQGVSPTLFDLLPVVSLAAVTTAAVYVPLFGLTPAGSFSGDLIVAVYLLSVLSLCTSLAGLITDDHYALVGGLRVLTQLFSYEAPFLLALLLPALAAGSWQIGEIAAYASEHTWLLLTQPIGFVVAVIGLMGKLELPPFDAPEAHTEIVAGSLTEYSGRGLALFRLSRAVVLVVGLALIAALYLGGTANPLLFFAKTLLLLFAVTIAQTLFARLRIDQTIGLWWRYGVLLALGQWLITLLGKAPL
ncbi:MAG: NADH-quinone oxidoreductase subunit H [Chloroflexi bacterium]|nr:NADH-quinone oxidoreductase subunit H [Chloroflexota bacterium]